MVDATPFIRIESLYKSFSTAGGAIDILRDLNLELAPGETLAVVGASGIGKSTLLQILGTLDRPTGGKIFFRGEDVFGFDPENLARFRNESIGFVFQFHHLLPEFSALENAMMPALIRGTARAAARDAASAVLARVGLSGRLEHRVGELSGGEQQRVALARALVLKPLLLLADEPTGNLDKSNSSQVHALLLELNREFGMTMVVVTHNLELAALMSRRVTIVDGRLAEND
jgi:lipoprotein-releasing system ATP-binding protein